jgi:hypothetical protein
VRWLQKFIGKVIGERLQRAIAEMVFNFLPNGKLNYIPRHIKLVDKDPETQLDNIPNVVLQNDRLPPDTHSAAMGFHFLA